MEIIDSNDAQYPETRRETWECSNCGRTQKKVLVA
jgi:hypothetical protein